MDELQKRPCKHNETGETGSAFWLDPVDRWVFTPNGTDDLIHCLETELTWLDQEKPPEPESEKTDHHREEQPKRKPPRPKKKSQPKPPARKPPEYWKHFGLLIFTLFGIGLALMPLFSYMIYRIERGPAPVQVVHMNGPILLGHGQPGAQKYYMTSPLVKGVYRYEIRPDSLTFKAKLCHIDTGRCDWLDDGFHTVRYDGLYYLHVTNAGLPWSVQFTEKVR